MCTGIRLECANGVVAGRTGEFGFVLYYDALFLPVGTQYTAAIPGSTGVDCPMDDVTGELNDSPVATP